MYAKYAWLGRAVIKIQIATGCIYWVIQIANKKAVLRVSNVSDSAGDKALLQF